MFHMKTAMSKHITGTVTDTLTVPHGEANIQYWFSFSKIMLLYRETFYAPLNAGAEQNVANSDRRRRPLCSAQSCSV
jgi:hypothetical protein